jgi:hypothetical protein
MKKTIFTVLLLSATLFTANASDATTINQVGKFKFSVTTTDKNLTVLIYDSNNELIHKEYLNSNKLFKLDSLSDGQYTIKVLDWKKNSLDSKTFEIKTETKRDLIVLN